jgi:flagellar biosynthesis protein FliR
MVRSYVLSWTFVGCRMANMFSLFPGLGEEAVSAQIWMFWILPLLATEFALQWRKGSHAVTR